MGADLGVPLSDLKLLCVSVAGGVSRKTFTQFSKREKREKREGGGRGSEESNLTNLKM